MNSCALPEDTKYKKININGEHCILTQFQSKEDVEKWITSLQAITKETWTIEKTYKVPSNAPRNVFKRIYRCHFNTSVKRTGDTNKPKRKSKNIDCKAKINIVIKKLFENSKSKKPTCATKDWPCIIKFKNEHNHRSDVVEALRKRPISDETKIHLTELFSRGHSAASAYHTFCAEKMEEYGDEYYNILNDRFYIPTKNDVANWKKTFKDVSSDKTKTETGSNMLGKLEEILAKHKDCNNVLYKISCLGEEHAVAICTPLMQRALELKQANEIMFVDATEYRKHKLKVYFFVIQCAAGGLPVGCILSSSPKSNLFDVAVGGLIEIMPTKIQPKVILTDNDLGKRNVLQNNWPGATLLRSTFHVLKAVWSWIITSNNGVPRDDAHKYYELFKTILYARTLNELERAKEDFIYNCKHDGLKKYVQEVYPDQELTWCIFYRLNLPLRDSDTNNYAEVMFRLLKDIPLERTKAFNFLQLTDYIIVCFENYYKQRILDLLFQRTSKTVAAKYLPSSSDIEMTVSTVNSERLEFYVRCENSGNTCLVDMLICKCSCTEGFDGKHCKHQGSVLEQYNFLVAYNTLSKKMKLELYRVATGKSANKNIYKSLFITCTADEMKNDQIDQDQETPSVEMDIERSDTPQQPSGGSNHDVKDIKIKYEEHCNAIVKYLEEDPDNFAPALEKYLENFQKCAASKTTLLSGLNNAFK